MPKKLAQLLTLAAYVVALSACSNKATWKEEVKLLDGRMITVTQTRRYDGGYNGQNYGSVDRESWVTIELPELGNQPIVWHEKLSPMILNIFNGKLYIVGTPPTEREFLLYGSQRPPYIGFQYVNGNWKSIPFKEIPEAIYDVNMLSANSPPNKSDHVALADKAAEMLDRTLPTSAKRIDPSDRGGFN